MPVTDAQKIYNQKHFSKKYSKLNALFGHDVGNRAIYLTRYTKNTLL